MKKISLVVFATLFSAMVFSQRVSLGLKGGLNISNLNNTSVYEMESMIGFNGGVISHVHLSSLLALQPEIVYSGQGVKYATSDGAKHTLFLNTVNFPLQCQYMFKKNLWLQTAPQIEFLVDVKDKVGGVETGFFTAEDFKTVNFSWSIGLGYLNNSGWGLDCRYNFGINSISNGGPYVFKNRVFQLGLFYMLNNSHKANSVRKGY